MFFRTIRFGLVASIIGLLAPIPVYASADQVQVTVDRLNIRSGPGTTYNIIGTLSKPVTLPAISSQDGWTLVRLPNGNTGWIINDYVKPISKNSSGSLTVTLTADNVNLRSQATTGSPIITTLKKGTTLPLVSQEGDWYRVSMADGSQAYIAGWLVQKNEPSIVATPSTSTPITSPSGNDLGALGGEEKVLIYHTHNRESWNSVASTKGSSVDDPVSNITLVGSQIGQLLGEKGIQTEVILDDIAKAMAEQKKGYSQAYQESYKAVIAAASEHPALQYYFDIHRDSDMSKERTTVSINNTSYARILFVVGTRNSHYEENKRFAEELHALLERSYPGLSRGVILKGVNQGNGEYNQTISPNSLLVEIGGTNNTIDECYNSATAFADVFSQYYLSRQESVSNQQF